MGKTTEVAIDNPDTDGRTAPRFRTDAPLVDPEQDRLGRADFAKFLAEAIMGLDVDEGFVFALLGTWGSGKTTTLNFVLHYLDESDNDDKPVVVKFNPWWFSGRDQLLLQFFTQLRLALSLPNVPDRLQRLGSTIQTFGKALTPLAYIPVTQSLFGSLKDIFRSLGTAAKEAGEQMEEDVWGLRQEVDEALMDQDKHILIVIDDIDRLPSSEIQQMFRLIKAVADFPKTIYLLAFDRQVVIDALEGVQDPSGVEYLEKIVQAPFDLPLPSRTSLHNLLFQDVDDVLKGTSGEYWDEVRWGNVFYDGIDGFIRTPRDIKRYINVLRPAYAVVREEVNPIDFLAIEALRVFVPEVYQFIRSNQELFAGSNRRSDDTFDRRKRIYDEFLEALEVSREVKESVDRLLERLFPRYARAFGGPSHGPEWESEWRRQLRVCSPDVFPTYFRLSLEEGAISRAEMEALLSLADDPEALTHEIIRLASEPGRDGQTSRAREFLDRLEDYTRDDIPVEDIEPLLQALYDAGDALLEAKDKQGFASFGNHIRVLRVTYQLLHRLPSQQERFEILERVLSNADSIPMITHRVGVLGQEFGEFGAEDSVPEEKRTISRDHLARLERITVDRIEEVADTGTLFEVPDLPNVLFVWKESAGDESVQEFVEELIDSDAGLADFLESFLQRTHSYTPGDRVSYSAWWIHVPSVAELTDVSFLEERAETILAEDPDWLTDRRRLALEVFLDSAENKPWEPPSVKD